MTIANEEGYEISDDRARLDLAAVHGFLAGSYWSPGIPRDTVERAVEESWCFGLYAADGGQAGFARLVTDYATYAYLCDVFVLDAHRGKGLGRWLMQTIFAHDATRGMRRITLATKDAHELYRQVGFTPLANPARFMEIARPDIYQMQGMTS
ncbi:MAG: GNAT family N-acetyltransferase [Parvularculaceae bacterium]